MLSLSAAGYAAQPSHEECATRDNGTQAKLLECISDRDLWSHLAVFQKIADAHPGAGGHGDRNTGTAGYRASVDYVARLMRGAGYRVTVQPYQWRRFEVLGQPEFERVGRGRIDAHA